MTYTITSTDDSRGVVHVRADSQQTLCRMFMRLQEFYESPYAQIAGHYFTAAAYLMLWDRDHAEPYIDSWHGFNIPGHVARRFFALFGAQHHDVTAAEEAIFDAIKDFKDVYIIGSHDGDDNEDALPHELVHATWYLDHDYQCFARRLVADFRRSTYEGYCLERALKQWGYADSTMEDEFNAFLSTTDEEWWAKELEHPALAHKLWVASAPFRELAAEYRTDRWLAGDTIKTLPRS